MNDYWQNEFRERMAAFDVADQDGFVPASVKIRISSGCFHREHSPGAYERIDRYLAETNLSDAHFKIEEHESGPEILVYLAITTAGLSLAKSIVELITTIIKARSEGVKRGDKTAESLEVVVRGHTSEGNYVEEKILRIPVGTTISMKQLEDAFPQQMKLASSKRQKKKR